MHNVVHVVPQIVILTDVADEATLTLFVKHEAVEIADEANIAFILLHDIFLVSELRKSIYDYTEKNVVQNNLHQQEERNVHEKLDHEFLGLVCIMNLICVITGTTTK